ncbi:MAG: PfkB family carbohydrate kinase [Calditrichaceae bacterium]
MRLFTQIAAMAYARRSYFIIDLMKQPVCYNPAIRWFHSGGIFAALSDTTSELIIEGMQAAKKSGTINSFDLNYRGKLWSPIGGLEKAQKTLRKIAENVDALVGNEEDLQLGLGIPGPPVTKKSKFDTSTFFQMIEKVIEQFPNIKLVATTLREVESANKHKWGAVLWYNGQHYESPPAELNVLDRIGGGDGFATGLIYGLISGREPEEALRLGWAHGALLTSFPGDTTMAKLAEVEAFAKGGSARVQR